MIRPATPADVATILRFVRELAAFEREPDAVEATEPMLHDALFGAQPAAEAVIAEATASRVGFALFFHNFSTWTGRRGLYLEDLYVTPGGARAGRRQGAAAPSRRARGRRAAARASNGRCSTGTPRDRFLPRSIGAVARWTNGPSSACSGDGAERGWPGRD